MKDSPNVLRISTGHCIGSIQLGGSLCGQYKNRPLHWLGAFWAPKVSFVLPTEDFVLILSRSPTPVEGTGGFLFCPGWGKGKIPGVKKGQVEVPDLNLFSPRSYRCSDWTTLPAH